MLPKLFEGIFICILASLEAREHKTLTLPPPLGLEHVGANVLNKGANVCRSFVRGPNVWGAKVLGVKCHGTLQYRPKCANLCINPFFSLITYSHLPRDLTGKTLAKLAHSGAVNIKKESSNHTKQNIEYLKQ